MNLNKDDDPVIWTSQSPCDMAGFYPKAKRTPFIGAAGYYRMGGDEFAH